MKKLVLLGGGVALVAWGGPTLVISPDAVAGGLFGLAALLGLGVLGLALFWAAPLAARRTAVYDPPEEPAAGPLLVPIRCYRPNGEVDWLLGELLPAPTG